MSTTLTQNVAQAFPIIKEIDGKTFLVDITTDPKYIDQALALRYKIFNLELNEGLESSHETQRDQDRYDEFCDHLVLIDQTKDEVVGTYRIMPMTKALKHIGFYSESEFDLSNIYKHLPKAAEIGRACTHSEYRRGLAMNLLWYGLATYMEQNDINSLFGCTSLNKGDTSTQASLIYKICEDAGAVAEQDFRVTPKPGLNVKGFNPDIQVPTKAGNPKRLLPTLMRGYLSVGVKICGAPAYDPEFDVIDFFTLFDYKGIAKTAKRFFSRN